MQPFRHKYVTRTRVVYAQAIGGGLVSDGLLVTANIPLDENAPNYDPKQVEELTAAVIEYNKSRNNLFRSILFEEG